MRLLEKHRWFYIPLLLLLALLLLHAQYSFGQRDESFYIATTNRLYHGARLLIDEWHPSQSYTPLLVPLYAIYLLFVPSGAGVLLFFRVVYILFAGAVALWLFHLFSKRYGVWLAGCAAMLCLLYSRANICGVSYYNLCLQFSIASFLSVSASLETINQNKARFLQVISGVLIACAVLCSPYLALFVVMGLVALLFYKRTRSISLHICLGVMGSAVLYILCCINLSDISSLIANIPYALNDPEHTDLLTKNLNFFLRAIRRNLSKRMLLIELAFCVSIIVAYGKKKRIPTIAWLLYTACMIGFMCPVLYSAPSATCYIFFFPFSIYVFPFVLHHLLNRNNAMPVVMYVFGFCIAATFFLASNTSVDAMTVGYCLSSVAAILTAKNLFAATNQDRNLIAKGLVGAIGLLLLWMVLLSGAHRFIGIFRDAPLPQLTVRLEQGPAKGLLTTPSHAQEYNSIFQSITELASTNPDATVLHTASLPWAYLCTDWKYGTPTAWTTKIGSTYLQQYYQLHPDSIPDYVFVYEPNVGQYQSARFNNHKPVLPPNQNDLSGEFYEYMQTNGSIILSTEYVTVYKLNNN